MHSYRANGVALGGEITRPFRTVVAPQAALSLSPTGGRQTSRVENFKVNGIISVRAAHTEVGGSFEEKHRLHTSYATSVIERLNIADVVTAERVVSRIYCYSPVVEDKDGESSFSIVGSHFEDLRIAGHRIELHLGIQKFNQYDTYAKLRKAHLGGEDVDLMPWGKVTETQLRDLEELEKKYAGLKGFSDQARSSMRLNEIEDYEDGYLYSAASQLNLGKQPQQLKNFGGIVFVPGFGVIRLAEVRSEKSFRTLAMIRVDMGSPIEGRIDIACTDAGAAAELNVTVYGPQPTGAKGKRETKWARGAKKTRPPKDIGRKKAEEIVYNLDVLEPEVAYEGGGAGDGGSATAIGHEAGGGAFRFDSEAQAPQELTFTTVQGTPQLEIKEEVVPGTSYRMAVFVDQGPAAEGADVQAVRLRVPLDLREIPVQVWLDCSSHFNLEDMDTPDIIKIHTETGVSNEFRFTVRVIKGSNDKRPMYVSAFFRYDGRPCGRITRYLELANGVLRWKSFVPRTNLDADVLLPRAHAPAAVVIEREAQAADIRVEVLRTAANDGRQFTMHCFTPQKTDPWIGSWNLPEVARDLVETALEDFMQASSPTARFDGLMGAGIIFWKALPDEVQRLLWDALEKGATTMSVVSEEPVIPWELMVPHKTVQKPRKPLGVELRLGRWITGDYKAAPQRIPLKTGYVIAPKDSHLENAPAELRFLTQELRPRLESADEVLPASYDGVNKALGGPPRDIIHFICHGRSAKFQTLELDEPDTINSNMVLSADGFRKAFQTAPLAFLNACEVGGQLLSLDGVGGFANSFIELGASAVIAPLWAVDDKAAYDVTRTFYTKALDGVPFAEIMKQIRAKAYDRATAVDSYAAYCFYGDPMTTAA